MTDSDLYADTPGISEVYAVVFTPRKNRKRFAENCVHPVASKEEAIKKSDAGCDLYAARVVGPSRSSEGVKVYYLVDWLD
jgi:hypothetical protein